MCIRLNRTHSTCHHPATGTAGLPSYLRYCSAALEASALAQRATPCTGTALEDRNESVSRPYCDACIKSGIDLFIARGLDPDVYARGMGVSLNALIREYPGWLD